MIDIDDFRKFLVIKRGLDDNSIRLIIGRFAIFSRYCTTENQVINKIVVEDFLYSLKQRDLKPNSINAYVFMLRNLWFYCKDRGLIVEDFSEGVRILPHPPPPIEVLSQQEIDALISVIVPQGKFRKFTAEHVTREINRLYSTFTLFLSRTGARFEEAAGLTCRHVDIWQGKVTFVDTKNKEHRSVWITEPLISKLETLIHRKRPDDLVFLNFTGGRVIPQNYGLYLSKATKQLNITKHVHAHIFRHSFATQLYVATKDIGLVQVVLGHKDIKSTMIYIHLADDAVRKGLYRHPYNRAAISGDEFVNIVDEELDSFRIHEYPQFDPLKVRAAKEQYVLALREAIKTPVESPGLIVV